MKTNTAHKHKTIRRNLNTQDAVLASVDYIHSNPLRRGLCQRPEEWLWSNFRTYQPVEKRYGGVFNRQLRNRSQHKEAAFRPHESKCRF